MTAFRTEWFEDGAATVVARLCDRDATGAATGVAGEGKWVKKADLTTITCAVYDLDGATPGTPIATPTVTIASAIEDTPITDGQIWAVDDVGWNFYHDLAETNFPTANHKYRVIYTATMTGGKSWWFDFVGVTRQKVPA